MKLFLACLLAVGHVTFAKTLPKAELPLKNCRLSDPDLNSCLLENASPTLQVLRNGVPELNLKPLDPLNVDFMSVEGDLEAIKIKMVMKNITLHGHADAVFQKVKFDPESSTGELSYHIPVMTMTCDYFATGRLFVIPLESSAHFNGKFTGVDMTMNFRLSTKERNGKQYFTTEKVNMKMHVDKSLVNITSIDPAQQPQVNVIQDFFNENDKLVLDTVNPLVNSYGGEFYKHIMESYIRRFTVDDILPQ